MKKNKRVILLSSCLLVLTLGAFAFMSAYGESSAAGKPIKIGVILSMTGPLAPAGPNCKQGVELRLHEAGGQVAGRPIELIYEDDKTDQVTSLEKARKLVESDKVDLILGPIALEFIINYTAKAKVPQIGFRPIIPRPDTMKLPYTFIPPGSFKTFIYPMAWYAYDKMGFRTATCMATDRDDGIEQVAAFKEAFEERGGKVIHSQLAPIGTADYAPYLIKLKKADVMMIFFFPPEMMRFLRQYNELGLFDKMPVIIPLCEVLLEAMMPALGDSILGITGSCDYFAQLQRPMNERFVKSIKEKYGVKPDSFTLGGYEAMAAAIAALKATGGNTDSENLRKAILGMSIETPSTRKLTFSSDGWGTKDMHIFEIRKRDSEYIWAPIHTYNNVDPLEPVAPR